jgi:carbon-monoxide dehydrogenase large subunit
VETESKRKTEVIDKVLPRVDALEKVTGAAIYVNDIDPKGLLFGKALRSEHAHAKIIRIDTSKAEELAGVIAVVTGKDLPMRAGEALRDMPFLAIDKVRYVGEPVAAVAAITKKIAEEALTLIEVEYEKLPSVFDALQAMESDAPIIHEDMANYPHIPIVNSVKGTNICNYVQQSKGDVEKGFEESDFVFEDTFTTHKVSHAQIEPHGTIAQVDPHGKITLWTTSPEPHRLRKDLADALGWPLTKIRVIAPYMGGGFGGKGGLKSEALAIPLAMKVRGRPVKVVFDRDEVFEASVLRHSSVVTIKTGVKRNGEIVAMQMKIVLDTGAYAEKGPTVCDSSVKTSVGPYKIPHTKVEGYCVYTNNPVSGAFRGYGAPQPAWACESQLDIIAKKLNMDPLEIRLKNALDLDFQGTVGVKECLEKAAEAIHWHAPKKKDTGRGIACIRKVTNSPSSSHAVVSLDHDGSVSVLTSTVEIGQGSRTVLTKIAAEELGITTDRITISNPDSDVTPYDSKTTNSRSTFHMGNAVRLAAEDVKRQLKELASQILQVPPEKLEVQGGKIHVKGSPEEDILIPQLIRQAYGANSIIGHGSYYKGNVGKHKGLFSDIAYWAYAAQAVEVHVDKETGQIEVLKIAAAHDVGKAIDKMCCEQQIEGGVAQGVGTTLLEQVVLNDGRIVNANLHDYKIPTSFDVPEIMPIIVETPCSEGPFGAKGLGEAIVVPTAPAIANAVHDAIGVRIKDLPLTPENVLKAIEEER